LEVTRQEYINKLYQVGYDLAKGGFPWVKEPKVLELRRAQ